MNESHPACNRILLLTLCLGAWLMAPRHATAADAPLRIGDRRLPLGTDRVLRFVDDTNAARVAIRHSGADWQRDFEMEKVDDIWQIDLDTLEWREGSVEFKFLPDGEWEEGPNRYAYVDEGGALARPPAVYLTWQRDPATTMTVHWHSADPDEASAILYRHKDEEKWLRATGASEPFPDTDLSIHTVEIRDLAPDRTYAFRREAVDRTYRFRTLPNSLARPVRFVAGGDVYHDGSWMDRMNALAGSLDPDFVVIGGDLAYADGRPDLVWRWFRYFESFYRHLRAPDGRMIPTIVAIGNHEVTRHYLDDHGDYEPGDAWRLSKAPYFYRLFAMPGQPGYGVLDIGEYLSLLLLDTQHTNPIDGEQLAWLEDTLASRRHVTHLLPVYHVPAYPAVRDQDDALNTRIRELWLPLFEAANVRLAFEHHDHAFKVTHPMRGGKPHPDGIIFLGDGAWGVSLRTPATPEDRDYLRVTAAAHHIFVVDLDTTRRHVRALDMDGNELDRFEQPVAVHPSRPEP